MAQELELQIVLETLLKSKGFEDAQKGLKQLSDATNQASVETASGAKKSGDALKDLGGKRGGIADLTRVILMNSGATGVAGEAAKAAGIGISFMGTAATGLSFAMAGLTFGVALLLPKIIEWLSVTDDASEKNKALTSSLIAQLDTIQKLVGSTPGVTDQVRRYAEQLKAVALAQQSIDYNTLRKDTAALEKEQAKLAATYENGASGIKGVFTSTEQLDEGQRALRNTIVANDKTIAANRTQLALLGDAIIRNVVLTNSLTDEQAAAEAQGDKNLKLWQDAVALQEHQSDVMSENYGATKLITEADKLNADAMLEQWQAAVKLQEAQSAASENTVQLSELTRGLTNKERDYFKGGIAGMEKMLEGLAKKSPQAARQASAALIAWSIQWKRVLNGTELLTADRLAQMQASFAQLSRGVKTSSKELTASVISDYASVADSLSTIFGKNKALAIAGAIANTFSAGIKTLDATAELGPWVSIPAMAAVIAAGLANVANIEKANPGFDDPFSDLVAAKLGRKSAVDFVNNFGAGFQSGLGMRGGGGGGTTVNNQNGMSINNLHMSGIIAGNETELLKQLNRKLIRVQRLENRTRIGA